MSSIHRRCQCLPWCRMDNDGIHKFAYRHDVLFADLLRLAVPRRWRRSWNSRGRSYCPGPHVSAGTPRFKQRHGDMMWRVPRRRGASDDAPASLVVVAEFQSTVDQDMALRMRDYRRMLHESPAVRRHGKGPAATLPLVVYNGSERWTAPGAVAELPPWSLESRLALAPFQEWDYVLLSLERRLLAAGGGSLSRLPVANRSAATLRLQAERTPADLLARLRTEWARFPGRGGPGDAGGAARLDRRVAGEHGRRRSRRCQAWTNWKDWKGRQEERKWRRYRRRGWASGSRRSVPSMWRWASSRASNEASSRPPTRRRAGHPTRRRAGTRPMDGTTATPCGAQVRRADGARLADLLGTTIAAEQMERVGDWIMQCDRSDDLLARVSAMRANGDVGS